VMIFFFSAAVGTGAMPVMFPGPAAAHLNCWWTHGSCLHEIWSCAGCPVIDPTGAVSSPRLFRLAFSMRRLSDIDKGMSNVVSLIPEEM